MFSGGVEMSGNANALLSSRYYRSYILEQTAVLVEVVPRKG